MITFLGTIFFASFLGSLHCLVMCGPLQLACLNCIKQRREASSNSLESTTASALLKKELLAPAITLLYSLGRLTTYSTLGITSGAIGYSIEKSTAVWGLQSLAGILGATLVMIIGLHQLLNRLNNVTRSKYIPFKVGFKLNLSQILANLNQHLLQGISSILKVITPGSQSSGAQLLFSFVSGSLSTLLPCAWLYSFVIIAGSTGSPQLGWLTMFSFWLGTLPIMFLSSAASKLSIFSKGSAGGGIILLVLGSLCLALHLAGGSGFTSTHTLLNCLP
jgi:sulfite exporter TauE/SafE